MAKEAIKPVGHKLEYIKDTFFEYLGKKDHVSASALKSFMKSPRMYYYEQFEKEREEKRHFAVGSALHEAVLEPELFKTNFIVSPKFDRRTKQGKLDASNFDIDAERLGKTVIVVDEMEMIIKIAENAMKNETLTELIKNSHRELSCYTEDPTTGLKLKMRPDSMHETKSIIVDIKTCLDSSPTKFKKDVYNYGYSISAAFYADFLNRETYLFAACEKQAPYQISIYALSDESMQYGREQYRAGLDMLKWCKDNDFYPDYAQFEVMKNSYALGNLDNFKDTLSKSELITILN
jgi:hypothetical protein